MGRWRTGWRGAAGLGAGFRERRRKKVMGGLGPCGLLEEEGKGKKGKER